MLVEDLNSNDIKAKIQRESRNLRDRENRKKETIAEKKARRHKVNFCLEKKRQQEAIEFSNKKFDLSGNLPFDEETINVATTFVASNTNTFMIDSKELFHRTSFDVVDLVIEDNCKFSFNSKSDYDL
jgi:hypothetical protein